MSVTVRGKARGSSGTAAGTIQADVALRFRAAILRSSKFRVSAYHG